jgi:hypothetical protein
VATINERIIESANEIGLYASKLQQVLNALRVQGVDVDADPAEFEQLGAQLRGWCEHLIEEARRPRQ